MGNSQSFQKIGFEDIQIVIKNHETYLLINTLLESEQNCLIVNTVPISQEETLINKYIASNKRIRIVIYGKHNLDDTVVKKNQQLLNLGFSNIFIYVGGLFEWLILQDIYGKDEFPTTSKQLDLLKYKPRSVLNIQMLENG
jgi:hypothetical protein